jgi:6-phosphogluconolactonase
LLRVAPDPAALYRDAVEEVTRIASEAVRRAGVFTFALAGGSTPRELYRLLAAGDSPFRARLPWDRFEFPWDRTHFFWGDERLVPPDHPDSNFRMARDAMLAIAPVPPDHVHRISGEAEDAATAAADYEQELRRHFGAGGDALPRFDLVLLGMGADGHTASLFPGSPALGETGKWAVAVRRAEDAIDRVTLTPPVFNNAAHVVFLVAGAAKAAAVKQAIEGDAPPERLPSRAIRPLRGTLLWLLEREAAALLGR